ncbi:MAG: HAMP domain-containing histidine kinase [Lachnospiraceae bacterium]|nr:HAMP domain-containing histidine kinase [Lachnospiraceae bacterium]
MSSQKRIMEHLDQMLEAGINGTFEESHYDETQLSKLESKWLRYLSSSKLAYQKTREDREKLQQLVSDISHQTKTPLSNILLYTELLQEKDLGEESQGLVNEIRKQSEKLEFLIQSLVKTSRLETGTFAMMPEERGLKALVEAAVSQVRPKAESKEIEIQLLPSESVSARCDAKWTQEALFNILDNAVKYSSENKRITVELKSYELFACISVADEGPGIAEEELPLVFGRFYRGKNVREESGVGIGLYLSRQIIEGQGGYITVKSELGIGSTFEIFLPR